MCTRLRAMTGVPVILTTMKYILLALVNVTAAQNVCFEGWHYHEGSCYGIGQDNLTWADSQEFCRTFRGTLAEIETEEENTFLKILARNSLITRGVWIGGTDIFQEGIWVWASTGQHIYPFNDWHKTDPVQPDEAGAEDCLVMWTTLNFEWADFGCKEECNFICETAAEEAIVG